MATGALDSNGIWQYGEDDSETTFSALLNKLAASTSTQLANGRVVQTVNSTLLTSYTSTSGTYVTTGLSATITPKKATNKILAIVHQTGELAAGGRDIYVSLYKNGIAILPDPFAAVYAASSAITANVGFVYLDSPSSTSALTYAVYARGASAGYTIREWKRSITLLEIAA